MNSPSVARSEKPGTTSMCRGYSTLFELGGRKVHDLSEVSWAR